MGAEWIPAIIVLTTILVYTIIYIYISAKEGEARSFNAGVGQYLISKNLRATDIVNQSSFLLDYADRFTNLGRDIIDETEYKEVFIKKLLEDLRKIQTQYGFSNFPVYFKDDERFEENKTLFLIKRATIESIDGSTYNNVETGVLLNDNYVYFLDGSEVKAGRIRLNTGENLKDYFSIANYVNNYIDSDLYYFDFMNGAVNARSEGVIFLPSIKITKKNIEDYQFFYGDKGIASLIENVEPNVLDFRQRSILDKEKTIKAIGKYLEMYNENQGYIKNEGGTKSLKYKAFRVRFAENIDYSSTLGEVTTKKGLPDNFLDTSEINKIVGTAESKNIIAGDLINNKLKNGVESDTSFFFYMGEDENGITEKYGYRITDKETIDYTAAVKSGFDNTQYYPFYSNALHLTLITQVYVPLMSHVKEIKFNDDIR